MFERSMVDTADLCAIIYKCTKTTKIDYGN